MLDRRVLLLRSKRRYKGEKEIERLLYTLIETRDKEFAKEWLEDRYSCELEGELFICYRQGFFSVDASEFPYDFTNIDNMCKSILKDKV